MGGSAALVAKKQERTLLVVAETFAKLASQGNLLISFLYITHPSIDSLPILKMAALSAIKDHW